MRKKWITIVLVFVFVLGCLVVFISNKPQSVYAYENITEYREMLAKINERNFNDFESRIIVKSKYKVEDNNAILSASGLSGLNIFQYSSKEEADTALDYFSHLNNIEYAVKDYEITIDDIIDTSSDDMDTIDISTLNHLTWGADLLGVDTYLDYLIDLYGDESSMPLMYIAVIDTGIDTDNEFLQGRIAYDLGISYYDSELYTAGDSAYSFEDDNSHGTHVAGTIVDLTFANIQIIPIKVLNSAGSGSLANVISGIEYATSLKDGGTNIVAFNMSLGGHGSSFAEEIAIVNAYNANIMPVIAGGNSNYYVEEYGLASVEKALTISALSQNLLYNDFECIAYYTNYGSSIDICLPGTKILSCVPSDCTYSDIYTSSTGGKYASISGTSMATPHATALVGLYATYYNTAYSVATVENEIKSNTYDYGNIGFDICFGYGIPSMELAINSIAVDAIPVLNYGEIDGEYNFDSEIDVEITNTNENHDGITYSIYYTLDGSYPTLTHYNLYNEGIILDNSTLLRFVIYAFDNTGTICGHSDLYEITYFKGDSVCNDDGTGFTITADGRITKYSSGIKDIIIPEYINGIKVQSLANNLFYGLNIESIVCEQDVDIEYYPFYLCSSLKSLTINSSSAQKLLYHCFQLEELNLPNLQILPGVYLYSVLDSYGFYGCYAFEGCFNLKTLNIPKITQIEEGTFSGYKKLETINLNWNNLTSIGKYTFYNCKAFKEDIVLNESITELGDFAFAGSGITSIKCTNVHKIEDFCFSDCENLKYIELPKVNVIGSYLIFGTASLQYLFLGDNDIVLSANSLTETNKNSFVIYCYDVDRIANFTDRVIIDLNPSIDINTSEFIEFEYSCYSGEICIYRSYDNVLDEHDIMVDRQIISGINVDTKYNFKNLANGTYYYIVQIQDVYNNICTEIWERTAVGQMRDIHILSNIDNHGLTTNSLSHNNGDWVILKLDDIVGYTLQSIVIDGTESKGLFVDNEYTFLMPDKDIIIQLTYNINHYQIYLARLDNCNIYVTDTQGQAISSADYHSEILLHYNVNDGYYISNFYYLDDNNLMFSLDINSGGITTLNMPASDITICCKVNMVNLDDFIISFNDSTLTFAISSYSGTNSNIVLPQYIKRLGRNYVLNEIGNYCFYNNISLQTITINIVNAEQSYIKIGEHAFGSCSNLNLVELGKIQAIGYCGFYACTSLEKIDLSWCKSIGDYGFYRCYNLKNVDLSSCNTLGNYAFAECSSLISVNLSSSLKVIPKSCFSNDISLQTINLENVTRIGNSAFWRCLELETIDLSNCEILDGSVDDLSDRGMNFYYCTSLVEVKNANKLKIIPYGAFDTCTELRIFDFIQCEQLGTYSFERCDKLENINLSNITNIGHYPLINAERIIFGKNKYLLETEGLNLSIYLSYMYVDNDYDGGLSKYYAEKFIYAYELGNYDVYCNLQSSKVTFKFEDGTVISSEYYNCGDNIAVPTNYKNKIYTYTLNNWKIAGSDTIISPEDITITYNDIDYILNDYDCEYINYTIKFYYGYDYDKSGVINDEGDLYVIKNYHYGDNIVFPTSPTKPMTESTVYYLINWSYNGNTYTGNNTITVVDNMNFIAHYGEGIRQYLVKWYDGDDNLIYSENINYGVMPAYNYSNYGTPTKTSADARYYGYVFNNWSPAIGVVNSDIKYVAQFTVNYFEYVIKYYYNMDYDKSGVVNDIGDIFTVKKYRFYDLIEDVHFNYVYDNLGKHYEYKSWSIDTHNLRVSDLSGYIDKNRTISIYATYHIADIYYSIKWFDGDSNLIYAEYYQYGETPVYDVNTYSIPQKLKTAYYEYQFVSWLPEITSVKGNAEYYAQFNKTDRLYNIKWFDGNDNLIYLDKLTYGSSVVYDIDKYSTPSKNETTYYKYLFSSWQNWQEGEVVTGDKNFYPNFLELNKIANVNTSTQMADVSSFSNIKNIQIQITDLNSNCDFVIKFNNSTIKLDRLAINSLLSIDKEYLSVEIQTNFEKIDNGNNIIFGQFYICVKLDNEIQTNLVGNIDVELNFKPNKDCQLLYSKNGEIHHVAYANSSTVTTTFNVQDFTTYTFVYEKPSYLWLAILLGSILLISVILLTWIIRKHRRKM